MFKQILRLLISTIFIVSGLVKAIDVRGFSFKLEEYFSPAVFNLPFFEKQALTIAIFVVTIELLLGLTLLLKIKLRGTLLTLIGLCVFFAFLTFYSAYFNKVTDCGCFGDAIKFTPWQSFWKDIALLLGLLILRRLYRDEKTHNNKHKQWKQLVLILLIFVFGYTIYHGIIQEPLIDFRDYKIGTNIKTEKAKINQNPDKYKTFYTLKNQLTGVEKEVHQDEYVSQEEYWKEGSEWTILENRTISKLVKEGYKSEIAKFKIEDSTGNDLTEEIINAPKIILVFSYNPKTIDKNQANTKIKYLQNKYKSEIIGVSTNTDTFSHIPNAMMDGTAIKTIARSNPFILVLENGRIIEKKTLFNS